MRYQIRLNRPPGCLSWSWHVADEAGEIVPGLRGGGYATAAEAAEAAEKALAALLTIYRIHWQDPDDGRRLAWAGSKKEAQRILRDALAKVRAFHDDDEAENTGPNGVEPVTVPTSRIDLIAWLNLHFTSDNG